MKLAGDAPISSARTPHPHSNKPATPADSKVNSVQPMDEDGVMFGSLDMKPPKIEVQVRPVEKDLSIPKENRKRKISRI